MRSRPRPRSTRMSVVSPRLQLRRRRARARRPRRERGDDQADRRVTCFASPPSLPARAHRQAVLADRNADAERRAQLHADRAHRVVERGVLARAVSPHAAIQLQPSLTRESSIGAASRFVIASPTAMRPEAGASIAGERRALAHAHRLAGKALEVGQRHAQSATGTCHGPTIGSRCDRPPTVRSPIVIRKRLVATVGWRSTSKRARLQVDAGQVERRRRAATRRTSRSIFGGLPNSTSIGMSIGVRRDRHRARRRRLERTDDELALSVATPTTANGQRSRAQIASNSGSDSFGRDRQHVALLALVAPDLLRRQAALLERHLAQVEARAAAGAVGELGERVRRPPAPTSWIARIGLASPSASNG